MEIVATQEVAETALVSLWVLLPALLAGVAGWLGACALIRRREWGRREWIFLAMRGAAAAVALWALLTLISRFVAWGSGWHIATLAVCGAAGMEALAALYERERRVLTPKTGRAVTVLRVALFLLVLFALAQPSAVWFKTRVIVRRVAVLVDESASMREPEKLWTPSQQFDLAALCGATAPKARPDFAGVRQELENLRRVIARAQIDTDLTRDLTDFAAGVKVGEEAAAFLKSLRTAHDRLVAWENRTRTATQAPEIGGLLTSLRRKLLLPLESFATPKTEKKKDAAKDGNATVASALGAFGDALDGLLLELTAAEVPFDKALYTRMKESERIALSNAVTKSRLQVADLLLADKKRGGAGLQRQLGERYQVAPYAFASEAVPMAAERWIDAGDARGTANFAAVTNVAIAATSGLFRARTDLTRALERVRRDMPAGELAGVLVLSDGGHNGEESVDVPARRLGAPIRTLLIGGQALPVDAGILNLRAPAAVPLHDRVRVAADVHVTGAKGRMLRVRLVREGLTVDERTITPALDDFRTEVRLSHQVESDAPASYRVEIDPLPGEATLENNRWPFDVAVSDERTSVLLADSYPRWEFRYLRNLLYGRDKTVHLQYVLLNPDEIVGQQPAAPVFASAGRPYGQAEANRLPRTPEEWRKFSVIILGDLPPEALDDAAVEAIRDCVTKRGALLVVVAGPRFMPGRWTSDVWRDLMPANWTSDPRAGWSEPPEPEFRLRPSAAGRLHPIMQIAENETDVDAAWAGLEPLRWRVPMDEIKKGAEVLAYAEPLSAEEPSGGRAASGKAEDRRALIVAQRVGAGKVLLLAFDQTWRLRYQVGDTLHHRFWGQIIRWGVGERLQAGGEFVRLGASPQNCAAGDTVRLLARLQNMERTDVKTEGATVGIYRGRQLVERVPLSYREDAEGLYEGRWQTPGEGGDFRLLLEGPEVEKLCAATVQPPVEMLLRVRGPVAQLEKGCLNADPAAPRRAAQLSGGAVYDPGANLDACLDFGPPTRRERERREASLWDTWPYLLLVAALATTEWLLRRKGGLP